MNQSTWKFASKLAVAVLFILGLIELGFALWTVLDPRYKSLAYNLADVGYMDLWILRYLSLCLFASSIITLVMCVILVWGLFSTHAFIFIASTMLVIIVIAELTVSILTFANKYQTRITLIEQLPKLVITYRQGNDERAMRALDILQFTFRCCGAEGRLSFQNNVPLSCNMFSVGCLNRTLYFLDSWMDALAYILLFFSLIKLFIVLFFYSSICLKYCNRANQSNQDSSTWRQSVSFDTSSEEHVPRQRFLPPTATEPDEAAHRYTENQRMLTNEYESSAVSQQLPTATMTIVPTLLDSQDLNEYYHKQHHTSRKLSSISERTEKTETDESEPDLLHSKYYVSKRKIIPTSVPRKHLPPKKLPVIKARRKLVREEDYENDSGVERSSSEKSFEDQYNQKQSTDATETLSKSKLTKSNSSSALSFSNVFITSVSQPPSSDDELTKPPRNPSPYRSLPNQTVTLKPILKKPTGPTVPLRSPADYYNQKRLSSIYTKASPLLKNIPKPNPRPSLKQNDSFL